jgi:hypothetical protein
MRVDGVLDESTIATLRNLLAARERRVNTIQAS